MRSFVLGLLAVLIAFISPVVAQRFCAPDLDPRSYASPSGEYVLYVDPSARDGSGPATYRLSRDGAEVWTTTHPFTWTNAFVCDDGSSAGYRYVPGLSGCLFHELGSFEVVVLDAQSAVRVHHSPARADVTGLIPFPDLDRFVVRIVEGDWNRYSERWCPYRISTGEALPTFRPNDGQPDHAALREVLGAVRVRGTPLSIVHWHQLGEYEPARRTPMGSRFALVDETGASVWTLDRPDDYAKVDEEEQLARLTAFREREHGAIARWDEPKRFDLDFVDGAERVTFEVTGGGSRAWDVREVGRRAIEDAERALIAAPTVEATLPPTPLALVGVLDLETCKTPVPFVHDVSAFTFDGAGNVAFLHWEHEPYRTMLGYANAKGERIADHALPALDGERGRYESDIAWLGGDRFLVGWGAYSSNPPGKAKVFAVSARTGESRLLAEDFGYKLNDVAGFGDGRFVALGDNRLDAFDATGTRSWTLTSADGLCGANHVAVSGDGRIVVVDMFGIQWIAANGKVGRYEKLEKLWGEAPGYLAAVEAGLDRGWIAKDSDRNVCMDAGGKPIGEVTPRYRDGRVARFGSLRAGPGGRLWTCDGSAIVGLDASGMVEVVLGESPDVPRVTQAATVALDREDRIHAVAERTGDVHVIDVEKGLVRVLRPPPGTITESINFADTTLSIDDDFGVHLEGDGTFVDWDRDGKLVGSRRARDGAPQSIAQPGTKNRFVRGKKDLELVDPTGRVLATFDRKPDGQWLKASSPRLAPDGSLAFFAARTVETKDDPSEAVIYGADGTPRGQVPLITSGAYVSSFAYDGARIALLANGRLHVHAVTSGALTIHTLPGVEGAKTDYWTPLLPRHHDEVWLFDGDHTLRRYALPRR